jgi:hypothetical protein
MSTGHRWAVGTVVARSALPEAVACQAPAHGESIFSQGACTHNSPGAV